MYLFHFNNLQCHNFHAVDIIHAYITYCYIIHLKISIKFKMFKVHCELQRNINLFGYDTPYLLYFVRHSNFL